MSQLFANNEFAMLIEIRQLIDTGSFQEAIDKIVDLEADGGYFSLGIAETARMQSLKALALLKLAMFEDALNTARLALRTVKSGDDNQLIAELQSTICRSLEGLVRIPEAEREYRDLISTYRRLDDVVGCIRSLNRLSRIHFNKGQYPKAVDYLIEALDYANEAGDLEWRARILGNIGTTLNLSGEFFRAKGYLEDSVQLNLERKDSVNLGRARLSLAFALMHMNQFDEASRLIDAAEIDISGYREAELDQVTVQHYRASLMLLQGEFEKAVLFAQNSLDVVTNISGAAAKAETVQARRVLAEALQALGRDSEALALAEENVCAAMQIGERTEVAASRRLIEVIAAKSTPSKAPDFSEIVRSLDEMKSRYELAMTYRTWSDLSSDTDRAAEYRGEANRILKSLNLYTGSEKSVAKVGLARPSALVGQDGTFLEALASVESVADSDIPVLLLGPTGVGKDMIAKHLHAISSRSKGPFISVNCATLLKDLAESELFGHEKGSFTGAVSTNLGLFAAADGGTLFLNEIGELSPLLQAKLLSAIEDKQFYPVGATVSRKVDVRIIAATNCDLAEATRNRTFRSDLYFRIAGLVVEIPHLWQRGDDRFLLFEHFVQQKGLSLAGVDSRTIGQVKKTIMSFSWPGNVRELKNFTDRAVAQSDRDARTACLRFVDAVEAEIRTQSKRSPEQNSNLNAAVDEYEKSIIMRTLDSCGGVIRQAATRLEVPEATLRSKMKKLQIRIA